jgi:hypothetical protein
VTLLWWALAAVAGMSVMATLLTRVTVALMGRFGGEAVHRTMSDTEYIVERHAVPPAWKAGLERKHRGLRPGCGDAVLGEKHRALARQACLRQLGRLITFAKKSSVVADEETREILLAELTHVRQKWLGRSWNEMCAADAGSRTAAVDAGPEE